MASRRRLVVVSAGANRPLSPRAERTRRVVHALADSWDVSVIAGPRLGEGVPRQHSVRWAVAGVTDRLVGPVLLDLYEPWSWRRFRRWKPDADLGLLIGWPFSPLFAAGRRLARRGIPYVVDIGDPFAL